MLQDCLSLSVVMSHVKPGDDAKAQPTASATSARPNPKVIVTHSTADGSLELQENPTTSAAKDAGTKSHVEFTTSDTKDVGPQSQVTAVKSTASTPGSQLQETAVKSTTSAVKDAGSKEQTTTPGQPAVSAGGVSSVASKASGLRQRNGKVEDIKSDHARASGQGNFHTLCVIEFAVGIPGATVEWLLGKIQAPRSQGGGELNAEVVEDPEKVQINLCCFPCLFVVCLASTLVCNFCSFSSCVSLVLCFCLPTIPTPSNV